MTDEQPEPDFLRRAIDGDEVALTVLLSQTRRRLFDFVAKRIPAEIRGQVDPDDVAQDTQVEICRHIQGFDPQGDGAFERWARVIAIRKLRDAIKRHRAKKRGGDRAVIATAGNPNERSMVSLLEILAGPGQTPSRVVARVEAVDAMQEALNQLPEDHRRAIGLVHIEGQSVAQAAEAMGRTDRAIHGLLRRGLKQLRERMGDAGRFLSSTG